MRPKPCRRTPVSSSTTARDAAYCSDLHQAIAVFFVPMALYPARPFRQREWWGMDPGAAIGRGQFPRCCRHEVKNEAKTALFENLARFDGVYMSCGRAEIVPRRRLLQPIIRLVTTASSDTVVQSLGRTSPLQSAARAKSRQFHSPRVNARPFSESPPPAPRLPVLLTAHPWRPSAVRADQSH